jgi:hypothetical protein
MSRLEPGAITPVLSPRPGGHAAWEREGTIDDACHRSFP